MSNKASLEIRPVKNGYIVYESVGHRHEMTDDKRTHVFNKSDKLAEFIGEFYAAPKPGLVGGEVNITSNTGEEYRIDTNAKI